MFAFTEHLKNEMQVIHLGLSLLETYSSDLTDEKLVPPEDIRLAIYAIQIAFEETHLAKEEAFLIAKLQSSQVWNALSPTDKNKITKNLEDNRKTCKQLLDLRLFVDKYETKASQLVLLKLFLIEFVSRVTWHLENEIKTTFALADQILTSIEQKEILQRALEFGAAYSTGQICKSRLIFNRLRFSRGLPAA